MIDMRIPTTYQNYHDEAAECIRQAQLVHDESEVLLDRVVDHFGGNPSDPAAYDGRQTQATSRAALRRQITQLRLELLELGKLIDTTKVWGER